MTKIPDVYNAVITKRHKIEFLCALTQMQTVHLMFGWLEIETELSSDQRGWYSKSLGELLAA